MYGLLEVTGSQELIVVEFLMVRISYVFVFFVKRLNYILKCAAIKRFWTYTIFSLLNVLCSLNVDVIMLI